MWEDYPADGVRWELILYSWECSLPRLPPTQPQSSPRPWASSMSRKRVTTGRGWCYMWRNILSTFRKLEKTRGKPVDQRTLLSSMSPLPEFQQWWLTRCCVAFVQHISVFALVTEDTGHCRRRWGELEKKGLWRWICWMPCKFEKVNWNFTALMSFWKLLARLVQRVLSVFKVF